MTAVHESLRAPVEHTDSSAPREDRIRYGVSPTIEHKREAYVATDVILVLGVTFAVALVMILALTAMFWELWFGVHPSTGY